MTLIMLVGAGWIMLILWLVMTRRGHETPPTPTPDVDAPLVAQDATPRALEPAPTRPADEEERQRSRRLRIAGGWLLGIGIAFVPVALIAYGKLCVEPCSRGLGYPCFGHVTCSVEPLPVLLWSSAGALVLILFGSEFVAESKHPIGSRRKPPGTGRPS